MSVTTQPSVANPLAKLPQVGQSVWLDFIKRSLITGGELRRLVAEDAIGGVTSNPAIFQKAIEGSDDYVSAIAELAKVGALSAKGIYEGLAIKDIQDTADVLRPVYDRTKAHDGYVSLEVSPELAKDTKGTLEEARRLWAAVSRPNLMIKVPATSEGVPAIKALLSEGINVNVTLLFARERYEEVARTFIEGIEGAAAAGRKLETIASVASFFVSRIDTLADSMLAEEDRRRRTGRARRASRPSWARSRWPTRSSPTRATSRSSRGPGGRPCGRRARRCSGCCGPAPAPRTPPIATSSTSRS